MMEDIKVYVVAYPGRKNLVMRYKCPLTGKQIARSTGTHRKSEADRVAGVWEAELREGRYQRSSRMAWADFVEYVEAHYFPALADATVATYKATFTVVKEHCNPSRLGDMTTQRVTMLRTKLALEGRTPATIARHMRTLAAILRWAQRQGLLAKVPDCPMPKVLEPMKGRPITGEEFDRMVKAVPKLIADKDKAKHWKFYLRCLWASGLRLRESLTLTWDDRHDAIYVDLSGRRPMLRIPASVEKGKRNRQLPVTPELAELLLSVPEGERKGRVFKIHQHAVNVSQTVCGIGEKAGVVVRPAVGQEGKPGYKPPKFASAHDLRRSFGTRWSQKLTPARLKAIMRHSEISTTMRYYVNEDADSLADALWEGAEPAATEKVTL